LLPRLGEVGHVVHLLLLLLVLVVVVLVIVVGLPLLLLLQRLPHLLLPHNIPSWEQSCKNYGQRFSIGNKTVQSGKVYLKCT